MYKTDFTRNNWFGLQEDYYYLLVICPKHGFPFPCLFGPDAKKVDEAYKFRNWEFV